VKFPGMALSFHVPRRHPVLGHQDEQVFGGKPNGSCLFGYPDMTEEVFSALHRILALENHPSPGFQHSVKLHQGMKIELPQVWNTAG
jgi:hypothetical protein